MSCSILPLCSADCAPDNCPIKTFRAAKLFYHAPSWSKALKGRAT